jgi:hypothetical protein
LYVPTKTRSAVFCFAPTVVPSTDRLSDPTVTTDRRVDVQELSRFFLNASHSMFPGTPNDSNVDSANARLPIITIMSVDAITNLSIRSSLSARFTERRRYAEKKPELMAVVGRRPKVSPGVNPGQHHLGLQQS